jgi:hypothetical protein
MTTVSSFIGPSSPRCVGWIGGPKAPWMDSGGQAVMFRRPALLPVPLRFAPESHISRFGVCVVAAIVPEGIAQKTLRSAESARGGWDVEYDVRWTLSSVGGKNVEMSWRDGDRYAVDDWGCDQRCICSGVAEGIVSRIRLRRAKTGGDEGGRARFRDAGSAAGGESNSVGSSSEGGRGGGEISFLARRNWGRCPYISGEYARSL